MKYIYDKNVIYSDCIRFYDIYDDILVKLEMKIQKNKLGDFKQFLNNFIYRTECYVSKIFNDDS